jgi:hypothetical protein
MEGGIKLYHSLFTSMRIKLVELRKIIANEVRIFLTETNGDNPGGDPEVKIKFNMPPSRGLGTLRTASLKWGKDEKGRDLLWHASEDNRLGFGIFTIHGGITKWVNLANPHANTWTFETLTGKNRGVPKSQLDEVLKIDNLRLTPSYKRI